MPYEEDKIIRCSECGSEKHFNPVTFIWTCDNCMIKEIARLFE